MTGHQEREHSSASIRYGTFDQYLEAQQKYAWLFCHTLCSIQFQDLVDAIKEGRAIAISDVSHKNKWGKASWRIMSDTNEAEKWAGLHITPGRKDDQSAFRSEIGGIYAIAVEIELLCKLLNISNGSVSFVSDCEAALYYIFDRNKKSTAATNSFDLIMATRKVLDQLPISFSYRHVPAHQDISRDILIYGIEQTTIAIQMLRPFGKNKSQQAHYLHRQTCVMNHGHYGYRENNFY
jgi:hypothetical protein